MTVINAGLLKLRPIFMFIVIYSLQSKASSLIADKNETKNNISWCVCVCLFFSNSLSPRKKTWHAFCPFFCAWSVKLPSSSFQVQLICLVPDSHILLRAVKMKYCGNQSYKWNLLHKQRERERQREKKTHLGSICFFPSLKLIFHCSILYY